MATSSGSDVTGLISQYVTAKYLYHSGEGESPLSDAEFDALERHLLDLKICGPEFFKKVGAAVLEPRDAVPLPEPMGSLEKIRSDEEISKWLYNDLPNGNHQYCVMAKVDGLSVELVYENGYLSAAYTRGDGLEGTLITRHLFLVPNVPNFVPAFTGRTVIRGELYMPEKAFEEHYAGRYKNSRNLVAGVTRRKQPTGEDLSRMRLAVYHIYNPDLSKTDMLNILQQNNFSVPDYFLTSAADLTQTSLASTYAAISERVEYRIDGLVIEVDDPAWRASIGFETHSLNPAYARAFKVDLDSNMVTTTVEYVEWAIKKDGYLIPKVILKPVELGGVTIKQVAAHNARYVVDYGLGPGAEVVILRSGDVIPKIVETTKKVAPQFPEVADVGAYTFNDVDLILVGESSTQKFEQLVYFFDTLQIENLSSGVLKRFFDKGYDTPEKILAMSAEDMIANIEGVKKASAEKFINSIKKVTASVYLPRLMQATGSFGRGFGESRAETLFNHFKGDLFSLISWPTEFLKSDICMIKGFSDATADMFVCGIRDFKDRYDDLAPFMQIEPYKDTGPIKDVFQGATFVFSGVRSEEKEIQIVQLGGTIGSSVSSKTKYLIVKDKNSASSKVEKARSFGVQILDMNELALLLSQMN